MRDVRLNSENERIYIVTIEELHLDLSTAARNRCIPSIMCMVERLL